MAEVQQLAAGLLDEVRDRRKGKLQPFVASASEAANAKVNRTNLKRPGEEEKTPVKKQSTCKYGNFVAASKSEDATEKPVNLEGFILPPKRGQETAVKPSQDFMSFCNKVIGEAKQTGGRGEMGTSQGLGWGRQHQGDEGASGGLGLGWGTPRGEIVEEDISGHGSDGAGEWRNLPGSYPGRQAQEHPHEVRSGQGPGRGKQGQGQRQRDRVQIFNGLNEPNMNASNTNAHKNEDMGRNNLFAQALESFTGASLEDRPEPMEGQKEGGSSGPPASLCCGLCQQVCKRGVVTACCSSPACRACAIKAVTRDKRCWACGGPHLSKDLVNCDRLRAGVEKWQKGEWVEEELPEEEPPEYKPQYKRHFEAEKSLADARLRGGGDQRIRPALDYSFPLHQFLVVTLAYHHGEHPCSVLSRC